MDDTRTSVSVNTTDVPVMASWYVMYVMCVILDVSVVYTIIIFD